MAKSSSVLAPEWSRRACSEGQDRRPRSPTPPVPAPERSHRARSEEAEKCDDAPIAEGVFEEMQREWEELISIDPGEGREYLKLTKEEKNAIRKKIRLKLRSTRISHDVPPVESQGPPGYPQRRLRRSPKSHRNIT